jgi:hypothetical protein
MTFVQQKHAQRDTVAPTDAGDLSHGREAPMVITPRALLDLARQLVGDVRRVAKRRREQRVES